MRLWGERTRRLTLTGVLALGGAVALLGGAPGAAARTPAPPGLPAQERADSTPSRPVSVLFIDDYDMHRPVWQAAYAAIVAEVTRLRGPDVEILPESLDVTRSPDADHVEETMRWLVAKYRGRPIDVVLAHGAASLETAIRLRSALGTELPILYLRADPGRPISLRALPDVPRMRAMVVGSVEAAAASVMNRALPRLEEVVVVAGSPEDATFLEGVFLEALPAGVKVTRMANPAVSRVVEATRAKPEGTVALYYTTVTIDESGRAWRPQEHLRTLVPRLDVPVFVSFSTQMGGGVLGGPQNDPTALGTLLGGRLAELLDGRPIESFPNEVIPGWTLSFDWGAARRFGIRESSLEEPVTWVGRPEPVWTRYPRTTAASAGLAIGLVLLSASLARSRNRMREAKDAKQHLSRELIRIMDDERARIARELHDDVCQDMTVLALQLDRVGEGRGAIPAPAAAERLRGILGRTRSVARELHPVPIGLMSLSQAISSLAENVAQASPVHFAVTEVEWPRQLPPEVTVALYRSVQEAVQNVVRHSGASACAIHMVRDAGKLEVTVRDDGVGFPPGVPVARQGIGLLSMSERMGALGGLMEIAPSSGAGTVVRLTLPARVAGVPA